MSKQDAQLKALREYKSRLKDQIIAEQRRLTDAKKEVSRLTKKKNEIEQKIGSILRKGETLEVADHAIVRYLERVEKGNIEQIKHNIITEKFLELFNKLDGNSGEYPNGNGLKLVVRNRRIITIKD